MMQISPNVSFCFVEGRAVFLDLTINRYFAVGLQASEALKKLCAGEDLLDSERAALISLEKRGWLREHLGSDKISPAYSPLAESSALDGPRDLAAPALMRALACRVSAGWAIRALPLLSTLRRIQRRKQSHPFIEQGVDDALERSLARTSRLANQLVSTRDKCLVSSIALVDLLARHGLYPQLTFGIRLAPFGAHCWVQRGETALSDAADSVRQFTPILVI